MIDVDESGDLEKQEMKAYPRDFQNKSRGYAFIFWGIWFSKYYNCLPPMIDLPVTNSQKYVDRFQMLIENIIFKGNTSELHCVCAAQNYQENELI